MNSQLLPNDVVEHIMSYVDCCGNCKRYNETLIERYDFKACRNCLTRRPIDSVSQLTDVDEFLSYFNIKGIHVSTFIDVDNSFLSETTTIDFKDNQPVFCTHHEVLSHYHKLKTKYNVINMRIDHYHDTMGTVGGILGNIGDRIGACELLFVTTYYQPKSK